MENKCRHLFVGSVDGGTAGSSFACRAHELVEASVIGHSFASGWAMMRRLIHSIKHQTHSACHAILLLLHAESLLALRDARQNTSV